MLDAYDGRLYLYRLDVGGELLIGLSDTCTGYDTDALCELLMYGGVCVESATEQAEEFTRWWNDTDLVELIESGADGELRDALKPFDDANVFFEITDLKWDLG